ncbi:MAG: hypothetical protein Pg6A_08640 [Termitinemataceae bacterium]|nr:MAG: hypothetical protein Pg6A_08640 [Termitinemataceae bacterium]
MIGRVFQEKRSRKLRLFVCGGVIAFHAILLFAMRFNLRAAAESGITETALHLVNISEAAPLAAPGLPQKTPPPVPQKEDKLAETIIEKDDDVVEAAGAEKNTGEVTTNYELSMQKAYIDNNYRAISRRIQNALVYPAQARRTGVEGRTEVAFILEAAGTVREVRLRRSSGSAILDEAACQTVSRAAPYPPPHAEIQLIIPVVFSLR